METSGEAGAGESSVHVELEVASAQCPGKMKRH